MSPGSRGGGQLDDLGLSGRRHLGGGAHGRDALDPHEHPSPRARACRGHVRSSAHERGEMSSAPIIHKAKRRVVITPNLDFLALRGRRIRAGGSARRATLPR